MLLLYFCRQEDCAFRLGYKYVLAISYRQINLLDYWFSPFNFCPRIMI